MSFCATVLCQVALTTLRMLVSSRVVKSFNVNRNSGRGGWSSTTRKVIAGEDQTLRCKSVSTFSLESL